VIPINYPLLQKIHHWRMVTAWMMKLNWEGLHKLLSGGLLSSDGCNGWTKNIWGPVEVR